MPGSSEIQKHLVWGRPSLLNVGKPSRSASEGLVHVAVGGCLRAVNCYRRLTKGS